jgi:hypothetical protein
MQNHLVGLGLPLGRKLECDNTHIESILSDANLYPVSSPVYGGVQLHPVRRTILFVGLQGSAHLVRWISVVGVFGFEIHLFPFDAGPI